jgi:hypothetical protein
MLFVLSREEVKIQVEVDFQEEAQFQVAEEVDFQVAEEAVD